MAKHPMQPIEVAADGVIRFKGNEVIRYLRDAGMLDLNWISTLPVPQEDKEQFWQLLGYSVSGYGDLSFISGETVALVSLSSGGRVEVAIPDAHGNISLRASCPLLPKQFSQFRGYPSGRLDMSMSMSVDELRGFLQKLPGGAKLLKHLKGEITTSTLQIFSNKMVGSTSATTTKKTTRSNIATSWTENISGIDCEVEVAFLGGLDQWSFFTGAQLVNMRFSVQVDVNLEQLFGQICSLLEPQGFIVMNSGFSHEQPFRHQEPAFRLAVYTTPNAALDVMTHWRGLCDLKSTVLYEPEQSGYMTISMLDTASKKRVDVYVDLLPPWLRDASRRFGLSSSIIEGNLVLRIAHTKQDEPDFAAFMAIGEVPADFAEFALSVSESWGDQPKVKTLITTWNMEHGSKKKTTASAEGLKNQLPCKLVVCYGLNDYWEFKVPVKTTTDNLLVTLEAAGYHCFQGRAS